MGAPVLRRWRWPLLAAVLLALAAWLMVRGEERPGEEGEQERAEVEFPRYLQGDDYRRLQSRRTVERPPSLEDQGSEEPAPKPRRMDPVMLALPPRSAGSVMVVEANAIRHSPVGKLLLDCLIAREGRSFLDESREKTGLDPLEDLDRFAFWKDGVIFSGFFGKAKWDELLQGSTRTAYGSKGTLIDYRGAAAAGAEAPPGARRRVFGLWNDQLFLVGRDEAAVKAQLDRIEGRAPQEAPALDEQQSYGDVYGVLATQDLLRMVPKEQSALVERLAQVASGVELHVDASHDVGMVATFQGESSDDVEDLSRAFGSVFSLARLKAQADGNASLAKLLEHAKVVPEGLQSRLELALPLSLLEEQLAECRRRGRDQAGDGGVAFE